MEAFANALSCIDEKKIQTIFKNTTKADIDGILKKRNLTLEDGAKLLSFSGADALEHMARRAKIRKTAHFGKAVILYTPLYLGNHCINGCLYCGYNATKKIKRHRLSLEDIEKEGKAISKTGLKHILILTGESRFHTPISYIEEAVKILKKYFSSLSIEIYPLEKDEYRRLHKSGVRGVTLYQEVYDPKIYEAVHVFGPKKDYRFRLDAPERAAKAGMQALNIGALLGLSDWRIECFKTLFHAVYLQKKFPHVELSLSLPRIRPYGESDQNWQAVTDKDFVQAFLVLANVLPTVGLTLSTRESEMLRNHLVPLGVTNLSAGVCTAVGGHGGEKETEAQFEIADGRSVEEMCLFLEKIGYQPVLKDWIDF